MRRCCRSSNVVLRMCWLSILISALRIQSTYSYALADISPVRSSTSSKRHRFESLLATKREIEVSDEVMLVPPDIYIREAEAKDLKTASKILTDAFFSSNIFSKPLEWLKTYLSLQDTFPESCSSLLYYMLVACKKSDDTVVGICEVDCRSSSIRNAAPRPYMCNLAVDKEWRRKGIGKALIVMCEEKARNEWEEDFLHLRARKNSVAVAIYSSLGYEVDEAAAQHRDQISGDDIILLKKSMRSSK